MFKILHILTNTFAIMRKFGSPVVISCAYLSVAVGSAESVPAPEDQPKFSAVPVKESANFVAPSEDISAAIEYCKKSLMELPGNFEVAAAQALCEQVSQLPDCKSEQGRPIFHYQKDGTSQSKGNRVLAISLIHGDELPSGSVTRSWMNRLSTLDPRNTWRVIPIVNPDGFLAKTRYNHNKIDLNRNFPSKDWDTHAIKYWEKTTRKDPRRFPGNMAASESETKCLVKHIDEFKPDFVISIHTPLGVLDFDGPKVSQPGFKPLPWVGLGNYAGSLGRFMWVDKKVPVLTIELKGNSAVQRLEDFDRLQDISGTVAIQANKMLEKFNEKKQ